MLALRQDARAVVYSFDAERAKMPKRAREW